VIGVGTFDMGQRFFEDRMKLAGVTFSEMWSKALEKVVMMKFDEFGNLYAEGNAVSAYEKRKQLAKEYKKIKLYDALGEMMIAYHTLLLTGKDTVPGYKVKADFFYIDLPEIDNS
jgi:hypothetical protein